MLSVVNPSPLLREQGSEIRWLVSPHGFSSVGSCITSSYQFRKMTDTKSEESTPSSTQRLRINVGSKAFKREVNVFLKTAADEAIAKRHDIKLEPESESESEGEPAEAEPIKVNGRWLTEKMLQLEINYELEPTFEEIFKQIRLPSDEQVWNNFQDPIRRWREVNLDLVKDPIPWLSWDKKLLPEVEIKREPDWIPPSPPRVNMMGVADYTKFFSRVDVPRDDRVYMNVRNALQSNQEEVCIYQKVSCSIIRTTRKSLLEEQEKKKVVEEYGRRDRRGGRDQSGSKGRWRYDGRKDPRHHRDGARFRSSSTQRVRRRDSNSPPRRKRVKLTIVEEERPERRPYGASASARSEKSPPRKRLKRAYVEEWVERERRPYSASASTRSESNNDKSPRQRKEWERRSQTPPPRQRRDERWYVEEERRRKEWLRRSQTPPPRKRSRGRSEERREYHTTRDRSGERREYHTRARVRDRSGERREYHTRARDRSGERREYHVHVRDRSEERSRKKWYQHRF